MATRRVRITRTRGLTRSYCAFAGPDGEMRAGAKRQMRLLGLVMLASVLCALFFLILMLVTKSRGKEIPAWHSFSFGSSLFTMLLSVLQPVAQSRVRIEYATTDSFVCRVKNAEFRLLSPYPLSFVVELPGGNVIAMFRIYRGGEIVAEVPDSVVFRGQRHTVRGLVARVPPVHVDFRDHAGLPGFFEQSAKKRSTYRLAYEDGFEADWLLFIVVATLVL